MGRYDDKIISDEELKRREKEVDLLGLEHQIKIKGNIIKTFGELKKYITSMKTVYKLEPFLSDSNYYYIHHWFSEKERGLIY
jgi:hypothetical protein